mmetsp:Transcript_40155/g.115915  ORF Transcript_40155/g.115915 Transcript_40155/m.115915 type:complete len:275 (+) Transcript_40155:1133-1957(+)
MLAEDAAGSRSQHALQHFHQPGRGRGALPGADAGDVGRGSVHRGLGLSAAGKRGPDLAQLDGQQGSRSGEREEGLPHSLLAGLCGSRELVLGHCHTLGGPHVHGGARPRKLDGCGGGPDPRGRGRNVGRARGRERPDEHRLPAPERHCRAPVESQGCHQGPQAGTSTAPEVPLHDAAGRHRRRAARRHRPASSVGARQLPSDQPQRQRGGLCARCGCNGTTGAGDRVTLRPRRLQLKWRGTTPGLKDAHLSASEHWRKTGWELHFLLERRLAEA